MNSAKKTWIFLLVLFLAYGSFLHPAKIDLGLQVAANLTWLKADGFQFHTRLGYSIGALVQCRIARTVNVEAGLGLEQRQFAVSSQYAQGYFYNEMHHGPLRYRLRATYLAWPVSFIFSPQGSRLNFNLGVSPAFRLAAVSWLEFENEAGIANVNEQVAIFAISLLAGAGYRLPLGPHELRPQLCYSYSLNKMQKNGFLGSPRLSGLFLNLAYFF